jgi:hypothetical protein
VLAIAARLAGRAERLETIADIRDAAEPGADPDPELDATPDASSGA